MSLPSEFLSRSSVRRKLDFNQVTKKPQETNADQYQVGKSKPSFTRRRLDFGKTEPSVLLRHPDLLPNQDDFDQTSFRVKRTCLTYQQKTALEEVFRNQKFPSRKEKMALAIELGVTELEIQMWFRNRRQKWKEQQKGSQVAELLTANPRTPFPRPFEKLLSRIPDVIDCDAIDVPAQPSANVFASLPAPSVCAPHIELTLLKSDSMTSFKADRKTSKNKNVRVLRQE